MTVVLRRATLADTKPVAALLTELGYPSTEGEARDRLSRSLGSVTSCCLVAVDAEEVVGLMSAELVPYFPTGTMICRLATLVVSSSHRGRGIGEKLLAATTDYARQHQCSGIEITSAERRADTHRFYERHGYTKTSFRFFRSL